jgi:hypothetical protein
LIAVLWLIFVLAALAVATVSVVGLDLDVTTANIHGFRARQLAEMGVAVGANPAVTKIDPILNQFDGAEGEGFRVQIRSEGGRFNINSILLQDDRNLLKAMFISWGMELDAADEVADSLFDWVDADDEESLNGAEIADYENLGRVNQPFNRPFYDLDEMRLVLGMDLVEALRPDWRDWFTVWSGGGLDLNEASAERIAVAAEVSLDEAVLIPEAVAGMDGARDTEDDALFRSAQDALAIIGVDGSLRPDLLNRFTVNDTTTRIESTGITPGATRRITLILRNRTGQPAILERTEEVIP